MKVLTIIGFLAAIGTTGAWLPQVRKTMVSGSARDFSWAYLATFSTGVILWVVYGIGRKEMPIILANVLTLILVLIVVIVKLRER